MVGTMARTPREVLEGLDERWQALPRSHSASRSVFLGICATSDITQPYHSLSYLGGALSDAGRPWLARDLAVEFWHYLMAPPVAAALRNECLERLASESDKARLLRLYAELLASGDRFARAWATLQDPEEFFELPRYLHAVQTLSMLPWLLTLLSHGAEYRTFSSASPPGYHGLWIDLAELGQSVQSGFGIPVIDQFYDHHAERIASLDPVMVGLTVPFLSQVEHSFALGWRLRQLGVPVVMGGPMMAKFAKYAARPEVLRGLHAGCDWLVPGEGETAVVMLADALEAGVQPEGVPNVIDLRAPGLLEHVHFEQLNRLPSPDYGVWDWSLYAAPMPGGLYSPTRGCYWNKCTFCDYGLAVDGPTSPWRVRSPERVVEDLRAAAPFVRHFFFAVDVLSPSYASRLSKALIDARLDVSWMADFRLESSFDITQVSVFKESGCIGAAFGMESAEQNTLDNICKGTDSVRLPEVVAAFADAGVPVQLMGFLGFPQETREQAQVTLLAADQLLEKAATAALGRFGLSKGSLVARHPERHGIEILPVEMPEYAISWDIPWRHVDGTVPPADDDSEAMEDSLHLTRGFPYPFLGATSTHHTQLWFERCDRAPFPIPHWSYRRLLGRRFCVVPAYERAAEAEEGRVLVMSRLNGRALDVPQALADQLDLLFPRVCWLLLDARAKLPERLVELLDFLVEHSLAQFLTAEEVEASRERRPELEAGATFTECAALAGS